MIRTYLKKKEKKNWPNFAMIGNQYFQQFQLSLSSVLLNWYKYWPFWFKLDEKEVFSYGTGYWKATGLVCIHER